MAGTRADGRTDTVCATARYRGGATASWYHSFTHPRHGEQQSLRLDLGNGECRLAGWIPVEMQLEAWTDRAAAGALRRAVTYLGDLGVPEREVAVTAVPPQNYATAAARGATHHVRLRLGHGTNAKQAVYATCIRNLLTDFLAAVDEARPPRVDIDAATAAVTVAAAATEATRTGRTLTLTHPNTDPLREGNPMIHTSSPRRSTRFAVGAIAALTASSGLVTATDGPPPAAAQAAPTAPLTNLAHLDWLGAEVSPPAQAGHTTYRLAEEPEIGVLWTYADRQADGTLSADRWRCLRPGHRHVRARRLQRRRHLARAPWSTCVTGSRPEHSRAGGRPTSYCGG